jgi:hypothetical protein
MMKPEAGGGGVAERKCVREEEEERVERGGGGWGGVDDPIPVDEVQVVQVLESQDNLGRVESAVCLAKE